MSESESIVAADDIYNEILYHVLGQFLVTKNNNNIATVLEELVTEIKNIHEFKNTLNDLVKEMKSLNTEIREFKNICVTANANASVDVNEITKHSVSSQTINNNNANSFSNNISSSEPVLMSDLPRQHHSSSIEKVANC